MKLAKSDIDNLGKSKSTTLASLLRRGVIEYIDVNEENNCLIALKYSDVTLGKLFKLNLA